MLDSLTGAWEESGRAALGGEGQGQRGQGQQGMGEPPDPGDRDTRGRGIHEIHSKDGESIRSRGQGQQGMGIHPW